MNKKTPPKWGKDIPAPTSEEAARNGTKGGKASGVAKRKKRLISDIIIEMLHRNLTEKHQEAIERNFGKEIAKGISNIEAMTLRQVEKALSKGDTIAYKELIDRAEGKAIQKVENEQKGVIQTINLDPKELKKAMKDIDKEIE